MSPRAEEPLPTLACDFCAEVRVVVPLDRAGGVMRICGACAQFVVDQVRWDARKRPARPDLKRCAFLL